MSRKVVSLRTKRLNVLNTELKRIDKMILMIETREEALRELRLKLKNKTKVLMTEVKSLLKENL